MSLMLLLCWWSLFMLISFFNAGFFPSIRISIFVFVILPARIFIPSHSCQFLPTIHRYLLSMNSIFYHSSQSLIIRYILKEDLQKYSFSYAIWPARPLTEAPWPHPWIPQWRPWSARVLTYLGWLIRFLGRLQLRWVLLRLGLGVLLRLRLDDWLLGFKGSLQIYISFDTEFIFKFCNGSFIRFNAIIITFFLRLQWQELNSEETFSTL